MSQPVSCEEFLETVDWNGCVDDDYDKLHYILHMPNGMSPDDLHEMLLYAIKLCAENLNVDPDIVSGHMQNSADPVFHILVSYDDETEVNEKHFYYAYKYSEFVLLKKFYHGK